MADEQTFDRVAAIPKSCSHTALHKNAKENYMLAGKIFCGLCSAAYCGNRMYSGRNKALLVTYRCGKRSSRGDSICNCKDINRKYIEDFIFKRVGEIIFSVKQIPQLIKTYYATHDELARDNSKALNPFSAVETIFNEKSIISSQSLPEPAARRCSKILMHSRPISRL